MAAVDVANSHVEVNLEIDGVSRPVASWENSVQGVLRSAGVLVRTGDEISPKLDQSITDGSKITINRARPVSVSFGGRNRPIHTTAATQAQLLKELKDRNAAIPATRTHVRGDLAMIAEHGTPVLVLADGKTQRTEVKNRFNIEAILQSTGTQVSPIDRVTLTTSDSGELQVEVTRVKRGITTENLPVKFKTVKKESDEVAKGKEKVETKGEDGNEQVSTYREIVGEETVVEIETARTQTKAPVDEVILVGTADPEELAQKRRAEGILVDENGEPIPSVYTGDDPRAIAQTMVAQRGWSEAEFQCLVQLWQRESGWNPYAMNPSSGAYGIPQSLPGEKMASAGADWRTNPATQIAWGLGYIEARYGTPCAAWGHSNSVGWY
ncbi:MAG: ubiquitin-like domain-containing protein [Actinomycetaceae bacterium]|nr:ubiquitin-like domain-containing protein [Actinomycetaceae bacterium]